MRGKRCNRLQPATYIPPTESVTLISISKKENPMNRLFAVLVAGAMLLSTGCKKDSSNPFVPPVTPPAASVTFTMHMESGTQGMIFVASPSADVKVTKVIVRYPAGQFTDTVTNPNPDAVIQKNSNIQINEYTGINTHQQWVLVFYGSLAATGETFVVTVNWDVV
jgi:hypothetical protein